jgi:RND family efflux transporter MFP subunit
MILLLGLGLAGPGCEGPAKPPEAKPLKVNVSKPVQKTITDYEIFSGRTEAIESTDVRARVTGYLDRIKFADGAYVHGDGPPTLSDCWSLDRIRFTDGAFVKSGDVLFEIDPRPYELTLAQARGALAQARANVAQGQFSVELNEATQSFQASEILRNTLLYRRAALSGSDLDKSRSDYGVTAAQVKVAQANLQAAEANLKAAEAAERGALLNLDWAKVTAPISGVVSRRNFDRGNMVMADQTVLTNIVRLDKVYAYFDVDERTWLDLRRRLMNENQIHSIEKAVIPVWVGLANDRGASYPFEGVVDFADNKLDPSTGTMRMRGTFENPDRFLQPGMFVRVKLPVGSPRSALLISDQAIGSDQGRPYVFVLNDDDEVVYRRVETGALHDGLREVRPPTDEGGKDSKAVPLKKGDRIVVNGLQRLRQGSKVEPTVVDMPNLAEPTRPTTIVNRPKPAPEGRGRAETGGGR